VSALKLDEGEVDFPRPKTAIDRRAFLWPETIQAVREVLAHRPRAKDPADADLVFLNTRGAPWITVGEKGRSDNVTYQFCQLLKKAGLHRPGLGFSCLRHTSWTQVDVLPDKVAIDLVMGHGEVKMVKHYSERIENEDGRLRAIADLEDCRQEREPPDGHGIASQRGHVSVAVAGRAGPWQTCCRTCG
jgi:integrase